MLEDVVVGSILSWRKELRRSLQLVVFEKSQEICIQSQSFTNCERLGPESESQSYWSTIVMTLMSCVDSSVRLGVVDELLYFNFAVSRV